CPRRERPRGGEKGGSMQRSGNPAVRYGLMFGGIVVVLSLIQGGVRAATKDIAVGSGQFSGIGLFFTLGYLVLYFLAGLMAARQSGRTGSGAVSGLIAGAIGGAALFVLGLIAVLTASDEIISQTAEQLRRQGQRVPPGSELRGLVIG